MTCERSNRNLLVTCNDCCSVVKWDSTLCDTMNCSTPGFPVLHYHLVFAQTHVHWVDDAIQSSHSLLPPSLLCTQSFSTSWSYPKSQFFTSGGQSIRASALAPVLPMNIQGWFPLGLNSLISLQSKGFSRVFSSTTIQSISSLMLILLYGPTLTYIQDYWKEHSFD